jgi:hypothetical protein
MDKKLTKKDIVDIIADNPKGYAILKDFYSNFKFKKGESGNRSIGRRIKFKYGNKVDVIPNENEKELIDFTIYLKKHLNWLIENNMIFLEKNENHLFIIFKEKEENQKTNNPLWGFFDKIKIFNSCEIHPKPNLIEYKENGYRTTEQIELEQERKYREKANTRSLIVSIFAIVIPLLIAVITLTIDNCKPQKPIHIIIDDHNVKKQLEENSKNTSPPTCKKEINNSTNIPNTIDTTDSTYSDSIPPLLK